MNRVNEEIYKKVYVLRNLIKNLCITYTIKDCIVRQLSVHFCDNRNHPSERGPSLTGRHIPLPTDYVHYVHWRKYSRFVFLGQLTSQSRATYTPINNERKDGRGRDWRSLVVDFGHFYQRRPWGLEVRDGDEREKGKGVKDTPGK